MWKKRVYLKVKIEKGAVESKLVTKNLLKLTGFLHVKTDILTGIKF